MMVCPLHIGFEVEAYTHYSLILCQLEIASDEPSKRVVGKDCVANDIGKAPERSTRTAFDRDEWQGGGGEEVEGAVFC